MATMLFHIGNAGVIVAVLICQAGKTERSGVLQSLCRRSIEITFVFILLQ